ncbi:MAG: hypothetical protein GY751_06650 [Bacteroidetes bacterium]|nr:hypothetical protein [Bacteroidota bacterium]
MRKIELKREILAVGKAKHQSVLDDYRAKINDLKSSEVHDMDDQMDTQQLAYNNEVNERIHFLAEQLNFAVEEMNLLNRILVEMPLHKTVTLGSVVVTDKRNFFVSVSIEDFKIRRTEYFGLSQKTPLYKEMEGKTKGDSFSFKDFKYVIKDVY